MAQLAGFKESGMRKIADRMGYTGPMTGFTEYLNANPDKQQMMNSYVNKAMLMASGGYVRKFQEGGFAIPEGFNPDSYLQENPDVQAAIEAGQFTSAADHFQKFGGGEERTGATGFTPPPQFDATSYLEANPDVGQAIERGEFQDARDHFQKFGGGEDREGVTGLTITQTPTDTTTPPTDDRDTVTTTPPADDRDTVTQQPSIQPDPDRTFATFQDLQNTPREFLTPEQVHILNFYSSTPEQQQAINQMPEFRNAQLPVGQYQPGVRVTAPTQQDPQPPAGDTVSGATGVGSVNGAAIIANRPDVLSEIQAGNTFGVDPATLEGLTPEQRNQRLAEAWFNTFGNQEGVNPNTGLSNTPSNFDNVSDQIIMDYLDQFPDLREAFGGPPYTPAILAQARAHYADFGRREIAEGNRARLVQFDLTPQQLQLMRFANDAYENLTDEELRRTYIQMGGNIPNFDRGATLLNRAQLQLLRDEFPDLAGMNDYELQQHFIQFGRQEMLTGKRKKIDAVLPEPSQYAGLDSIQNIAASRLETPRLAGDTKLTAQTIAGPSGTVPTGTDIATTTGQVTGDRRATFKTAGQASVATAAPPPSVTPSVTATTETADDVRTVTDATTGATKTFSLTAAGDTGAIPKAAVREDEAGKTTTSVTDLDAPEKSDFEKDVFKEATRADITEQEKVKIEADIRTKAKDFVEEIKAQSEDPSASATVAGQLANLLGDFDVANPPAWAAGAIRTANAEMIRRGLGASSIAGQALIQAAMEAALPIAQADASIFAQFEGQNLSNKQQMALVYAQQRANFIGKEFDQEFQARVTNAAKISDIADKNFTAEQQVALENSRAANTLNLQNLSNAQALVMAEAAALAQLDTTNLNNRQQAAVQEAQAFLQKDMAELSNDQQTRLFNAQQRIQSMFTDAAADNARKQFNASTDAQTDQFFANLATQTSQFNNAQKNAIAQFNSGQQNTINRFNAEIGNQRDQFNQANRLVIDQANAVWRRSIATADTAAINRVNELNASALLDISDTAYNDLWQQYSDVIEYAYRAAENQLDRAASLAEANLNADTRRQIADEEARTAAGSAIGSLIGTLGAAFIGGT
jgi:hypothetical protein